jgi:hypothetical protein
MKNEIFADVPNNKAGKRIARDNRTRQHTAWKRDLCH